VMPTMLQAAGVRFRRSFKASRCSADEGGSGRRGGGLVARPCGIRAVGLSACVWMERTAIAAHGKYLYVQAPRRSCMTRRRTRSREHNLATEMKAVADTVGDRPGDFRQKTSSKREGSPHVGGSGGAGEAGRAGIRHVDHRSEGRKQWAGSRSPRTTLKRSRGMRRVSFLMKIRRYDGAIRLLQQLIAKDASIPILYYELGDCYVDLRQYDKAVAALRKAVELAPTLPWPDWIWGGV